MKLADLDEQYARFPEIKRGEVQQFVAWINAQPHIADISEQEALHFFHACKYSIEDAKKVLDLNFTCRTNSPKVFTNWDCELPELKTAMGKLCICPLTEATTEGYRVIISKFTDTNTSNFDVSQLLKLYFMIFDMWMHEEGIAAGHIIVMDVKGLTMGHIARIGIMQMKKFLYYIQEAMAMRLIAFHFINIVPFMDKLLALMTPFMKKELMSMLHLHSNIEDLYKFIPQNVLPKDYGGPEETCEEIQALYHQKLRDNRLDLMEFEKRHQVNEKLRPGKPKNAADVFGIQGNFKKLDID